MTTRKTGTGVGSKTANNRTKAQPLKAARSRTPKALPPSSTDGNPEETEPVQLTVVPTKSRKPGKSAADILSQASDSVLSQTEELKYDYDLIEDEDLREEFRQAALTTRTRLKQNFMNVVLMGKTFMQLQAASTGHFISWFEAEFVGILSYDSVGNYINAAKLLLQFSEEELRVMPLSSIYEVGRSTVSLEAREHIVALAQERPITKKETKDIIKSFRRHQLELTGVSDKVRPLLMQSSISENKEELERLNKLSLKKQLQLAELMATQEKIVSVKQALTSVKSTAAQHQLEESGEVQTVDVQYQSQESKRGHWLDLINELDPESIDLALIEFPLSKDTLEDYGILAQGMHRALKPGGMMLAVVGQTNIQFVGSYLDPLQVAWTFMVRRRPGHSPRVIGRLSYASSYVPLSLSYKPPLKAIPGLIDDLRSEVFNDIPSDVMEFHLSDDEKTQNLEDQHMMNSIEGSLSYYISRLLAPTDVFMHLMKDSRSNFGIGETIYKTAFDSNASRVLSLIGT